MWCISKTHSFATPMHNWTFDRFLNCFTWHLLWEKPQVNLKWPQGCYIIIYSLWYRCVALFNYFVSILKKDSGLVIDDISCMPCKSKLWNLKFLAVAYYSEIRNPGVFNLEERPCCHYLDQSIGGIKIDSVKLYRSKLINNSSNSAINQTLPCNINKLHHPWILTENCGLVPRKLAVENQAIGETYQIKVYGIAHKWNTLDGKACFQISPHCPW